MEDKQLRNVFGQGAPTFKASKGMDPKTGMLKKFRFESIMDKT